jgi:hypothetical protein
MSETKSAEVPPVIHDLAEAFNQQAKYSNKIWLVLIATSALILFHQVDDHGMIALPFSFGSVDQKRYNILAFMILVILLISYCQAYARLQITTRFVHGFIEQLNNSQKLDHRKFFDNLVASSFFRVSGLVEGTRIKPLAAIYYLALKVVAISILLGIPLWALASLFIQLMADPLSGWIYFIAFLALSVTCIAVLQVLYLEFRHMVRVANHYWKGSLIKR